MNIPNYPLDYSPDRLVFYFESNSSERIIKKSIQFSAFPSNPTIYNLGFGDLDENGEIDDTIVSNNQDMARVLSTVIRAVFLFFETHSDKIVFFVGSTSSRTRLYQIALNRIYDELKDKFIIEGIRNDTREIYQKNVNYEAFLIKLK